MRDVWTVDSSLPPVSVGGTLQTRRRQVGAIKHRTSWADRGPLAASLTLWHLLPGLRLFSGETVTDCRDQRAG